MKRSALAWPPDPDDIPLVGEAGNIYNCGMESMLKPAADRALFQAELQFSRPARNARTRAISPRPAFLEFFAGSGLVAQGLKAYFRPVWANDVCDKKATVYTANHGGEHFHLGSITDVAGAALPKTALAWASFPCQDLSLASLTGGIHATRSGLVWEWLRIMDEMPDRHAY